MATEAPFRPANLVVRDSPSELASFAAALIDLVRHPPSRRRWRTRAFAHQVDLIRTDLLPIHSRSLLAASFGQEAFHGIGPSPADGTETSWLIASPVHLAYATRWIELAGGDEIGVALACGISEDRRSGMARARSGRRARRAQGMTARGGSRRHRNAGGQFRPAPVAGPDPGSRTENPSPVVNGDELLLWFG